MKEIMCVARVCVCVCVCFGDISILGKEESHSGMHLRLN